MHLLLPAALRLEVYVSYQKIPTGNPIPYIVRPASGVKMQGVQPRLYGRI